MLQTEGSMEIKTDCAVNLHGVTKIYSRTGTRIDTIKETILAPLARHMQRDIVTALDGVNLEIAPGEALGVIGPNGSGKSTLLKIIAGITEPTTGTVAVRGRVISMIELGTGIHADLSGEENIRLQGSILGLSAAQIEKRINEENSRPKRRFVSPSAVEGVHALYYDTLRRKIEETGTRNFPQAGGRKLYGELTMLVSINTQGQVVEAEIVESSGNRILDRRAISIVRAASPYGQFTRPMREQFDQLVFASRFRFTRDEALRTTVSTPVSQ